MAYFAPFVQIDIPIAGHGIAHASCISFYVLMQYDLGHMTKINSELIPFFGPFEKLEFFIFYFIQTCSQFCLTSHKINLSRINENFEDKTKITEKLPFLERQILIKFCGAHQSPIHSPGFQNTIA